METETRELSSVSRGKIKPQETDDWKNEKLFVPPLPPTNLRGCHLIRIQYDVFVSTVNQISYQSCLKYLLTFQKLIIISLIFSIVCCYTK